MKTILIMTAIFLGVGNGLIAQVSTGTISGRVYAADSTEVLPGAKVWIETEGGKMGVMCDADGKYKIDGVKPGIYIVTAAFTGNTNVMYGNVPVKSDGITFLDLVMKGKVLGVVPIVAYRDPLIDVNIPKLTISMEDIQHSPYVRNPLTLIAGTTSDVQLQEGTGQIIIRGSRPGDAVYYIDGVKMTDMNAIPGAAIGSVEAYTGGIPAKYGDTTGGVVILESVSYFDLYSAWLARQ